MKKWIPWLIGVVIIVLLVVRLFYSHIHKLKKEKEWYISELHYNFSARIDSVIRPGRALIIIKNGNFDPDREWQLKRKLSAHGVLHLMIVNQNWIDMLVPPRALQNDSIQINSDEDRLSLYRDGQLLTTRPLSQSLRQRPF